MPRRRDTARVLLTVEVTHAAANILERDVGITGMTQKNLHSRILQWYGEQPDPIRSFIQNNIPSSMRPLILREAASALLRQAELLEKTGALPKRAGH
jgi:hypothetical protein